MIIDGRHCLPAIASLIEGKIFGHIQVLVYWSPIITDGRHCLPMVAFVIEGIIAITSKYNDHQWLPMVAIVCQW